MEDGNENSAFTNNALETDEIVTTLQDLLLELDKQDLSVPAIKVAEAIDCLEQS